jgi:hypothetical protein
MKPQDVVILAALLIKADPKEALASLGKRSGLSASETCESLKRLAESRLINHEDRQPYRASAMEFFAHALRYVFPASPGARMRGLATAHSAEPLAQMFGKAAEPLVWPYENGKQRGESLRPLYPTVPWVSEREPDLYHYLALLDAVRAGAARERKAALEILKNRIGAQAA